MNPLAELFNWLFTWIFTTKAGKFIFISLFGVFVVLVVNTIAPQLQLGWSTILGCSLMGIVFAVTDKKLDKWF